MVSGGSINVECLVANLGENLTQHQFDGRLGRPAAFASLRSADCACNWQPTVIFPYMTPRL